MKKSLAIIDLKRGFKNTPAEVSFHDQVQQEFEYSEDHGESELEELKSELNEPYYALPSPMISREDATFANINPDQIGNAFGLDFQRNEPLDPIEKIDTQDEKRWELNLASEKEIKS